MAYSISEHFASVAEIWQAYFDHAISQRKRDILLEMFRARLMAEVPLPA
jgi:hypothetical protein